jgi:acetyl esterase/lipase
VIRKILLASGAPLLLAAAQAAAQPLPLATDAAAFGARQAAAQMDISPDGKRVVYIGPGPGKMSVVFTADLETGQLKPILRSSGDPDTIEWCEFAGNARIACRYSGLVKDTGQLIGFSRMISLNLDGSDIKELGQRGSSYDARLRQFDGGVIDWLPGDDESVLMTRDFIPEAGKVGSNIVRSEDGLGVVKLNVRTLKTQIVERPNRMASGYMSDGRGNVRLMWINEANSEGVLTGRTRYRYRTATSRNWELLADYGTDVVPLAVEGETDSLYMLKPVDGRYALFRVKLDGSLAATQIAAHARVDIDNVVRAGDGQRLVGYTYVDDKRHVVYFDEEYKKLASGLSKALPHLPIVDFVGASADSQRLLLFAGGDSDAGRYYIYEKSKRALAEVLPARPEIEKRTLASVKPITYPATDRTQIPAYLTLPPGSPGKNLPAIVLPHGGPSSRDEWGFDWLAQFLAARGYAVIQPNYRGSAGYGEAWMIQNGFKGWRTSIGDISAAAKWLAAQGIADPQRIAILGWSYGGYAALQGAATDPSLYKAVIAVAPVTDLQMLKDEAQGFDNSRTQARFIGSGPHIAEGSPLRHAAAISAPVLLVHGDMDANVGVAQSRKMSEALKSAGKSAEYIEFKGLDHYLEDSAARRQMLTRMAELLERTIGK